MRKTYHSPSLWAYLIKDFVEFGVGATIILGLLLLLKGWV
jgi:hypothetical protein